MTIRNAQGQSTPIGSDTAKFSSSDAGSARAAVGDAAFAQGRAAAIPSEATRYAENHKGAIIEGELELPFAPLRFATEGYQVAKEVIEGLLAARTIWELLH
jgi:hypothetical protein